MLRRDLGLFLHSLKAIFIIGILLLAGCAGTALVIVHAEAGDSAPIEVAVCNLDSDSAFGSLTITFVTNQELVSSLIAPVFYDTEAEAVQAVRDGAVAAIIIPEDFFSGVRKGDSLPCRLILNQESQGSRVLISSYVEAAAELLGASQQAIFTGDYYMMDIGADDGTADSVNLYMNLFMFREIESAQELYLTCRTQDYTSGGLSSSSHYAILYLSFLISLLTLGCYRLYQTDADRGRLTLLRSRGITAPRFFLWKILLPCVPGLLLAIAAGLLLPSVFSLSLRILPLTIISALTAIFLSALWGVLLGFGLGEISGAILFILQTAGLFLCGGIIPYARLRPLTLSIGAVTPLGAIYRLFSPVCGGQCGLTVLIPVALYTLAGFLLCRARWIALLSGRETA